jgi:DNA invertase Pin-like site-specific DNA recombinase
MATYAALVRVSQMGGRKVGSDRFHADEEQLAQMRAWADREDVTLEVLDAELGVSGGLPLEQRPSLLRAVEGCERGDYHGIVVAYLSRLGRNTREQLRVWARVEEAGKRIVVADGSVDTSTTSGRMQRTIRAAVDEEQREAQGERLDARVAASVAAGIWQRRQTPRGYRKDPDTRKLVPDRHADEVRQAFRMKGTGTPWADVARFLGMSPNGARKLLRNRVYLGELHVGKHSNFAAHPALVTLEEFEAAQADGPRPARAKNVDGPALLAGLVRCSACGHAMSRRSGRQYTYSCNLGARGACDQWASVGMAKLDAYVERIALAELDRLSVTMSAGQGVEKARAALESAKLERDTFLDAMDAAGMGVEKAADHIRSRQERVEKAQEQLRAELARRPVMPLAGTGAEVWESLDAHERNTLLRGLLAAVVVRRAGGRGARARLEDRVRVIAFGADLAVPERNGSEPAGVVPIRFEDLDPDGVLGVLLGEDAA